MAQVDVLLGVLSGEIDVVGWMTEVEGACHAGVAVGDSETAGIARVPVTATLDGVRVGDFLAPLARTLLSHRASKHVTRRSDGMGLFVLRPA